MIWSIAEQISAISQHLTLEPGDLLFTGSPAGVGFVTGTYLKLGDKIEAEITGLGHLNVEIVEE
ncbi:Fumarylpyruvate hydrolase [compost metagenome]